MEVFYQKWSYNGKFYPESLYVGKDLPYLFIAMQLIELYHDVLKESSPGKYTAYHGTGTKFSRFSTRNSTQGIIWFTSNKEKILSGSVGANGQGYVVTVELTINKPADWELYDQKALYELRRDGYDGAVLEDDDETTYWVFDPKQIKILKWETVSP